MKKPVISMTQRKCWASLCALAVAGFAYAADVQQFRKNYYGYGGDYTEVFRRSSALDSSGYLYDIFFQGFPIAVPKTYVLRHGAGKFTINNSESNLPLDLVMDYLESKTHNPNTEQTPYFYISAWAALNSKIGSFWGAGSDYRLEKYFNHLFLQVQSSLLCPNETYSSPFNSAALSDALSINVEVDVIYCPEGGFPIYAEAQYFHGVW